MNEKTEHHEIENLSDRELRRFALVLSAAFIVIFGLVIPWITSTGYPWWPWVLAAALIACSILAPQRLNPVYRGWTKFGQLLHKIMNPLILGLVFFLMFLPLGFVMRKVKGDPLRRKLEPDADSYRISSEQSPIEQMEKPF